MWCSMENTLNRHQACWPRHAGQGGLFHAGLRKPARGYGSPPTVRRVFLPCGQMSPNIRSNPLQLLLWAL